jgi:hypothetical protein
MEHSSEPWGFSLFMDIYKYPIVGLELNSIPIQEGVKFVSSFTSKSSPDWVTPVDEVIL